MVSHLDILFKESIDLENYHLDIGLMHEEKEEEPDWKWKERRGTEAPDLLKRHISLKSLL